MANGEILMGSLYSIFREIRNSTVCHPLAMNDISMMIYSSLRILSYQINHLSSNDSMCHHACDFTENDEKTYTDYNENYFLTISFPLEIQIHKIH